MKGMAKGINIYSYPKFTTFQSICSIFCQSYFIMPHSQSTCVAEASSADHVSNPFLLPALEYEPKPDLQADYPSSVISLREDHPSEFIMPSYIDPFWIHDLSQTVVLSPSATYYSLYTSDQGQTLSLYPGSPEISTFTFFDPDEAISFNLGYSKFDRYELQGHAEPHEAE